MGCPTGQHLHRCFSPQRGSIRGKSGAVRGTLHDGVVAFRGGEWCGSGRLIKAVHRQGFLMTNQAHPLPTALKQAASSLNTARSPPARPPSALTTLDAAPTNSLWPRQAATEACSISTSANPITEASHIRSQRALIAADRARLQPALRTSPRPAYLHQRIRTLLYLDRLGPARRLTPSTAASLPESAPLHPSPSTLHPALPARRRPTPARPSTTSRLPDLGMRD
jgi:hypothetical protein